MKKHYFLVLFSLYSIISFGQFDVSEMSSLDTTINNSFDTNTTGWSGDITFNNDGTKMYINSNTNKISQFSLSTPFDITTVSSTIKELTISYSGNKINFNNDGAEMFLLTNSHEIIKYNLSTPYEIDTATDAGSFEKYSIKSSETTLPIDFKFDTNGNKLFIYIEDGTRLLEYSLLNPFDVSSANYLGDSERSEYLRAFQTTGICFNSDGTKLYNIEVNKIHEHNLSVAFDVSTLVYSENSNSLMINTSTYSSAFTFDNTGSQLYIFSNATKYVYKYNLSIPFDISTATYQDSSTQDKKELNISSQESTPTGLTYNNDGTKLFTVGSNDDYVTEYSLNTAFDLSSATYSGTSKEFLVNSQEPTPQDVQFNNDGTKMFIIGSSGDAVIEYNLGTAFDVSTANYAGDVEKKSVNSEEKFPTGFSFNNDGTKMFIVGHQAQAILEYSLNTAYDVSTASYAGDKEKFPISSQDITPEGILFNTDGTKMFVLGSTNDAVFEYTLSTSFDVSTASYSGNIEKLDCSSEDNSPSAIAFSKSGNQLFMIGTENATIFTYSNGNEEETLSFDFSEKKVTTTVYLENGQFKNDVESQIYVFNIVGQQIPNNNLKSGIYIIILRSKDGTIQSFKRAI